MSREFSALFAEIQWKMVTARFESRDFPPPDDLISNVNIVPFMQNQVVLVRLSDGRCEVPGGTREPGEPYLETIRRELIEEAGARLISYVPFGAWHCLSSAEQPFRPYIPHPEFYRLAGYGEVELIGQPTNPPDGENVVAVEVVTLDEAAARFTAAGRPDLADLYRLAARVREERA